jgi:hypothetical protein
METPVSFRASEYVCEGCREPLVWKKRGIDCELVGVIDGASFENGRQISPGRAYHHRCAPKKS